MIGYGGAQFELDKVKEDGSTERQHLLSAWRQRGFNPKLKPEPLRYEELDDLIVYLWQYFNDLSTRRHYCEGGPGSINWTEIQAFSNMKNLKFEQWELDALSRLDNKFLEVWYKK